VPLAGLGTNLPYDRNLRFIHSTYQSPADQPYIGGFTLFALQAVRRPGSHGCVSAYHLIWLRTVPSLTPGMNAARERFQPVPFSIRCKRSASDSSASHSVSLTTLPGGSLGTPLPAP
jgi:hypothetical protein